jgi:uncharacterized protein (DUF2235 family)
MARAPIRIIILCDGTFQQRSNVKSTMSNMTHTSLSTQYFTNVALLSQCIRHSGKEDSTGYAMPQVVLYQTGIGTGSLHDMPAQLLEAATGLTLSSKVEAAYAFLVDNYLDGDEILLFGFSRGAYTARCIAAFINYAGIMKKEELAQSYTKIWKTYRARRPITPKTIQHAEATFFKELGRWPSGNAMRSARGSIRLEKNDIGPDEATVSSGGDYRYPRVNPPQIKVVGVW